MGAVTNPAVSVVVSTRNRPEHIVACVAAILSNRDAGWFELLVIDQSDTSASRDAVERAAFDDRLRWISTDSRGLSLARNIGISLARAPVLVFTDDDCRVTSNWVRSVVELFESDPELSLMFGAVALSSGARQQGFAASFAPVAVRELRGGLPAMRRPWGVGANMAVRRRALETIGVFDPALGAGAAFFAGEEIDLTIRALSAGLKVVETPHITVLHLGERVGDDAARLMRGYGIGFGAAFFKHVRLGTPGALRALVEWWVRHLGRSTAKVFSGHTAPGFGLLAAVAWGACRASLRSLDTTPQELEISHRAGSDASS